MSIQSVFLQASLLCLVATIILAAPSASSKDEVCADYCQNDGVCVAPNGRAQCYCLPEWEGERCGEPRPYKPNHRSNMDTARRLTSRVTPCSLAPPNLCLNGGLCQFNSSYSCACPMTFMGPRCADPSPCNNYCLNQAVCTIDAKLNPTCNCNGTGFSGSICHLADTTTQGPTTTAALCATFQQYCGVGTCVASVNGAPRCQCPATHSGDFCEIPRVAPTPAVLPTNAPIIPTNAPIIPTNAPIIPTNAPGPVVVPTAPPAAVGATCAASPCRNGRPCYPNGNTYYCYCGPSFTGKLCESPAG